MQPDNPGGHDNGADGGGVGGNGESGEGSQDDDDDDDDVVGPGGPVTLDVFLLDPAFKRELAAELDTQTGGLGRGWERLAEEFGFGMDKVCC